MFDPSTESLINEAPSLEGLDNSRLSKQFTRIYATVVAARMRLRELANTDDSPADDDGVLRESILNEVRKEVRFLAELAGTQEALIAVSPERSDRRAAAFVAGTAHYVLLQAERLFGATSKSRLEVGYLSPEISATLLFLIAGASADSAEMAREISDVGDGQSSYRSSLLRDIKRFAQGNLESIQASETFVSEYASPSHTEQAADALFHMLHRSLADIAAHMLGAPFGGIVEAIERAEQLCSINLQGNAAFPIVSLYSGPRHLAVLLKLLAKDFPQSSIANIQPPNGSDPSRWKKGVGHIAKRRPFLWSNHIEAIKSGYLDAGTSSAISFPTGAGKSTLSELKILATLCTNLDVIFLAPTLSLVDQTARALNLSFPDAAVEREYPSDDPFGFDSTRLPPISVMTPERCLALMGFEPKLFENVGLIVFDECHLLHAVDIEKSKRAVDSMLCVLNSVQLAPKADMLMLSAMMSNAQEISEWLQSILKRRCLALSINWKPTRQVRGCLVYSKAEIDRISLLAQMEHAVPKVRTPNKKVLAQMLARPQGFFGLRQTWDTVARDDYALLPLLDHNVQLALNKSWRLTPNSNSVASEIAAAAVSNRTGKILKTLVFCQTTVNANSTANSARKLLGECSIQMDEYESGLFQLALEEVGSAECLYIEVDATQKIISSALPHHARLLPAERHLHESLYKRADGIHVLAATSTLAQGMNLPSQVVIIAGDSRFDEAKNQLERLEAHELLNAAGRAGRAGESSFGFVLVIPSKIVHFEKKAGLINKHWSGLRDIFSQSDQCLAIEDPLAPILDAIQLSGAASGVAEYLLRRLPLGEPEDGVAGPARQLLARSLGAYVRAKSGDTSWVEARISSALAAKLKITDSTEQVDWADELAAKFGIQPKYLRSLATYLATPSEDKSIIGWTKWLFDWLTLNPEAFVEMTRQEGMETLFGKDYRELLTAKERGDYAISRIYPLLCSWMAGSPLIAIEKIFDPELKKLNKCENSRDFVLRVLPDLAYIASLPELVRRASVDGEVEPSVELERLSACVRDGFDTLEKLALYQARRRSGARVSCHQIWKEIEVFWTNAPEPGEDWQALYKRVSDGWTTWANY
ncbi:DEAD/DEAH box helicase [uncultured Comamonas sp.]|uniref:DEAD/DEAH box helicase n=1 Tax=uncultured Comamonas sp. TaxID=114710 RepID=UPI0025E4FA71|nr:DEAD/DEAH box helicase [uncultured Comamonas sp.]